MKLYMAGLYTNNVDIGGNIYRRLTEVEQKDRREVRYNLESYHYLKSQPSLDRVRKDGTKLFMDSGAFSAFTSGVDIDLKEYCNYLHKNEDIIEVASVLDGIGDPLKTYQNQLAMEQLGTKPLPCYHYGEDERYLDYYIANYEYITIGGMVPISTPQLRVWLDRIWNDHLIDGSGRPKVKVHGFGLTVPKLMYRYPWYSVDSSSWVQAAANGLIVLPWNGVKFTVSAASPARKKENVHVDNIPESQREALSKRIESYGYTVERLRVDYLSRWIFNCMAFTVLNDDINSKEGIFIEDQMRLF